jgi:hypothetical protein
MASRHRSIISAPTKSGIIGSGVFTPTESFYFPGLFQLSGWLVRSAAACCSGACRQMAMAVRALQIDRAD